MGLSIGSGIANYGTLACVSQMGGIPTLSPSASSSSRRIIHFSFSSSEREKGKRGKGICLRNHHWTDVVLSIPLCDITFSSKSSYIDWGSPFSPLLFGARGGRAKEGSWEFFAGLGSFLFSFTLSLPPFSSALPLLLGGSGKGKEMVEGRGPREGGSERLKRREKHVSWRARRATYLSRHTANIFFFS